MTTQVAVRLPVDLVKAIDQLVEAGEFTSRSDAVRTALEHLLVEAREAEIDRAILAGYHRIPDSPDDPWVDAATRAMVADEPW